MKKLMIVICGLTTIPVFGNIGQFREMKDGIGIVATACLPNEILVNAEGWKLTANDFLKKGYRPVRVRIENKSDNVASMSEYSIRYSSVEMEQLIEQFKVRQNLRPLARLVTGCTFFFSTSVIGGFLSWKISKRRAAFPGGVLEYQKVTLPAKLCVLYSFAAFVGWWYVVLSTPFYHWKLCEANERLSMIITQSLRSGPAIIPQGGHAEQIFLVSNAYLSSFEFSVFNEQGAQALTKFYINCA